MAIVRRAESRDIPAILNLLVQVNMVHHNGRPDLFNGPTTKYTGEELEAILADDATCFRLHGRGWLRPGPRILRPAACRRTADGGALHPLYRRYLRG